MGEMMMVLGEGGRDRLETRQMQAPAWVKSWQFCRFPGSSCRSNFGQHSSSADHIGNLGLQALATPSMPRTKPAA